MTRSIATNACGSGFSPTGRACRSGDGYGQIGHRAARGFSLIEVLAAFVILALVATALFRLFSASLGNASAAEEWSRALLVAQTRLDVATAAQPLREFYERGADETGAIRWETRVVPYVVPDVDPDLERASEALALRLYRISVDVKFDGPNGRERSFSTATLKMGPRTPS